MRLVEAGFLRRSGGLSIKRMGPWEKPDPDRLCRWIGGCFRYHLYLRVVYGSFVMEVWVLHHRG